MSKGWIAVDFDGTLAEYRYGSHKAGVIGKPVKVMVDRVKKWLAEGEDVRIFTARCYPFTNIHYQADPTAMLKSAEAFGGETAQRAQEAIDNCQAIRGFCAEQFGQILTITCVKDYHMNKLWDDRAIQVEQNTGRRIDGVED